METPRPIQTSVFRLKEKCKGRDVLTAIHASVKEVDLGALSFLAAPDKAVALIYTFGCVDGEDLLRVSERI